MKPETFTRFSAVPSTAHRGEDGAVYVEAVISSFARVDRGDWIEVLLETATGWTIPESVPLLDNHRDGSVRDVLGEAGNIRFAPGQMLATLRVTDAAIGDALLRGAPLKLSIGYRHLRRIRTVGTESGWRM